MATKPTAAPGVLQSATSPLVTQLRLTSGVRTVDEGREDRLNSRLEWVTKPSAGQGVGGTGADPAEGSLRKRLLFKNGRETFKRWAPLAHGIKVRTFCEFNIVPSM